MTSLRDTAKHMLPHSGGCYNETVQILTESQERRASHSMHDAECPVTAKEKELQHSEHHQHVNKSERSQANTNMAVSCCSSSNRQNNLLGHSRGDSLGDGEGQAS